MDKRLTIIFVLLILSGLLYLSTNFKDIMESFSTTTSDAASSVSDVILSSAGGGMTMTGGGIPNELMQSMQSISQMLNN